MKMFWALIVALVAATAVLLSLRGNEGPNPAHTATTVAAAGTLEDTATEPGLPVAEPETKRLADTDVPTGTAPEGTVVVGVGIPEPPVDPATLAGEAAPLADDAAVTTEPAAAEIPNTEAVTESAEADAAATPAADPAPAAAGDAAETGDSLLLNDRYRVTGEGTADSPYEIGFDMLVAVEQEYAPKKEGMKDIPEWIKALDGKHVNITGFVAFPFLSATADECMVMLNQWDGCCIGVPPTPYDAVEVQFTQPLDLNKGIPNYGTISGVFRTDPYLVNGWLIGLYVMDEARLINSGSKNQAGF